MKVKVTQSRRLFPRVKFAVLARDFTKNGDECLWNKLRAGQTVDIDARALLKGNDLDIPSGHSAKSFVEQELGVEVLKCSKDEEAVVGKKKLDEEQGGGIDSIPEIKQEELENADQEPNEKKESGGEK